MNRSDSDRFTRDCFDRILLKTRYIGSDLPDTGMILWGRSFRTPVMTAALSHLNGLRDKGTTVLAAGAKLAGAVNFCGMESYEGELDDIVGAGACTVRIIKPHAEDGEVFRRIEHAKTLGVFGMGMDIDHAYNGTGGYDNVNGLPMRPKTAAQLKEYVRAAEGIPFVVKGVLSAEDAEKCAEIGAAGIVVSHHHGIMPYSVPPLRVLPEIRRAVGEKMKIFVDCCIENGADVYKTLALGADAVCVGRALMDPLKQTGAEGVAETIGRLNGELSALMARTGFRHLREIDDSCLVF